MVEGLKEGSEHRNASRVVDAAFEKGDLTALDGFKRHTHPAVQDSYFGKILSIARQLLQHNPHLAIGVGVVTLTGITAYKVHERSVRRAQQEFAAIFQDPLSVPFKRTCQIGETALGTGLGEQFVSNLCNSSVHHPKEARQFWGSLNPYHPIFEELLYPETRNPRHLNPAIQTKYQKMIDTMIENLNGTDPKLGEEIGQAINGKIKKRRIE